MLPFIAGMSAVACVINGGIVLNDDEIAQAFDNTPHSNSELDRTIGLGGGADLLQHGALNTRREQHDHA